MPGRDGERGPPGQPGVAGPMMSIGNDIGLDEEEIRNICAGVVAGDVIKNNLYRKLSMSYFRTISNSWTNIGGATR